LEKLIETYLEYRKTLGLSQATLKLDRTCLQKFNQYLAARKLTVDRVTNNEIKDYWSSLQPLSRAFVHKLLLILKAFYRYCYQHRYLLLDPFRNLEIPRYQVQLPKMIPTTAQLRQILEAINLDTWIGKRDRAILELVYSAGLRLSETAGLKLDDLDLANRLVKVTGKGAKTRIVPFGKTAAFYLKLYLKDRPDRLNPILFQSGKTKGRMDRSTLERIFDRYAKQAGLKFRFHSLRHACALHLLQNKAGIRHIQELLGHSCLRTTQIYTQLLPLDLKQAHHRYHPREKEVAKLKTEKNPATSIQSPAFGKAARHG